MWEKDAARQIRPRIKGTSVTINLEDTRLYHALRRYRARDLRKWSQKEGPIHSTAVGFETLNAWMTAFAAMGMFRAVLAREGKTVRYLSDASCWFHPAYPPLVVLLEAVVCSWPLPALLKFLLVCPTVGITMLASHETLVRYTFVGRFLNGARIRPKTAPDLFVS